MKITVDIPDRDFYRVASVAERRGMVVADMVRVAVAAMANTAINPADVVKGYVVAGLPDGEISIRTGMTVQAIATHRKRLGLAPNKRAAWEASRRKPA